MLGEFSDASLPVNEGERFAILCQAGTSIVYKGYFFFGENVDFYFNSDIMTFFLNTKVEGKVSNMSGN